RPGVRPFRWIERGELAALLVAIGIGTYFLYQYRLEYLVLPLIAVAAWRFRLRGAAPAALVASIAAVWSAVHGTGQFAGETLLEKMVTLQAFNVTVSLASFVLASFVDARDQRADMARLYQSASLALAAKTDAIDAAAQEVGPPLAVLTSYLQILSNGELGPAPTRWSSVLRAMADKAWQVNRIVGGLVEGARIEARAEPATRAYLDLRDAVRAAVERARPRAELAGAKIVTALGADPVPTDADPRQIGRILDNLIDNSLTYTVEPPRLEVDAAVQDDRAIVRLIDHGVGISEEDRDRVFKPFHRVADPKFGSLPRSGLGLYASRQLAEANHGTLTLERSEPGEGTCFALNLPLSRSKPVRAPAQESA
ncbi:MAG TPA: HAMP domain-containing sensor histidine kinase, partial [Candidatus Dormibacteraeota bacterium]|nr:HAMP domain-containing sensor histidine kinase [Candidatus Dormibacteraeota bacterium]